MATTSFGRPAISTRYCWRIVVRFELRLVHNVGLARIVDAHAIAPAKSWSFTWSKHDVTRLTMVVFSSPSVSVMRSGRRFHDCASWPPVMYWLDVVSFF